MKYLPLTAIFLTFTAFAAEPIVNEEVHTQTTLPKDAPLSVVLVAQCGSAVGIYATMKDGSLLAFDMRTQVPFKDQIEWAKTAKHSLTVTAQCEVDPQAPETAL